MAKIDNMMSIIWMLSTDKKVTAKEISEKLEINIRTVYRYIDMLCASGVPIIAESGHNGGYTMLKSFTTTPLLFSIEEQSALIHASEFAKEAKYFSSEKLDSAILKLKNNSTDEQHQILTKNISSVDVIKQVNENTLDELLKVLNNSISNSFTVDIEYMKANDIETSSREINPYGIIYWNNNWYVVAYCNLRKEIRSFRVDRIAKINETEKKFVQIEDFSASEFFINGLLVGQENKKPLTPLVIKGNKSTIDDLCKNWFLRNYIKVRESNKVEFILEEEIIYKYIPNIFIKYRKNLQIIEPKALNQKIVEMLQELIEYYQV